MMRYTLLCCVMLFYATVFFHGVYIILPRKVLNIILPRKLLSIILPRKLLCALIKVIVLFWVQCVSPKTLSSF